MSNSNARVLRPELAELVEQALVTPLTEAQKALWLLQERAPRSVAYNLSVLAEVRGFAEPRRLSGAWQRLMDSHAVLRSCFEMHGDHVVQRTRPDLRSSFTMQESRAFDEAWLTSEVETRADEPFDLACGPLLRATLFTCGAEPARLLVVAHHIILDFRSLELLCRGLLEDVTAHSETSGATFREHVAAELKLLRSPRRAALIAGWKSELEGAPTTLDLPLQKPRPDRQTFTGLPARNRSMQNLRWLYGIRRRYSA